MYMVELIEKKRDGGELTPEEIAFMISGCTSGDIPDYQMSAMLMAICFRGMTNDETLALTTAMARSGDTLDLSSISGVRADKHSTGGVGDKTSLILCPMTASLGIKMAKMSGRGLGHTGGTIDKLESFPGFSSDLTLVEFFACVDRVGFAIAGQTANLTPADKKLYALRDVTGTVRSIPLIVSSVMSKKLAAGADIIVLDVKAGSGAFMKTPDEAAELGRAMVDIGRRAGRKTVAVISDMDEPLGSAVGNALEVKEAIAVLRGEFGGDLLELCLTLGAAIAVEGGLYSDETAAREALLDTIKSGAALEKLAEFVSAQGGDSGAVYNPSLLPEAPVKYDVLSKRAGYVSGIAADGVGRVCLHLGGGRAAKDSVIDLGVGILLKKKRGDPVSEGEPIAQIHAASEKSAREAAELLMKCYMISDTPLAGEAFIKGIIR